jgi:signal transduction histidine kinase/ligand-binding sensor domain-containing protein
MLTSLRWAIRGLLFGAVLLCLAAANLATADTNPAPAQFNVTSWHTEDGLPDGNVTAIEQTPDGYVWVGTFKGLARFDGMEFNVFDTRSPAALPDDHVTALRVDGAGRLWVACESGDLLCYQQGAFLRVAAVATNGAVSDSSRPSAGSTHSRSIRPTGLAEDEEGGLWLQRGPASLLRVKGGRTQIFTATNGLPAGSISALVPDRSRQPWLLAGDAFYRWRGGKWAKVVQARTLGATQPAFGPAQEGGLWFASPQENWSASPGRVYRLQEQAAAAKFDPTPWKPYVQRSQVTALLEDRSGRLWLGMHWSGLYCSGASGNWLPLANEGPLAQCRVTSLFEDRQGAIWVGTLGDGLYRLTRRAVTATPLPEPSMANLINTVCAAQDGTVWVGTDGAGVFRYRAGAFTHFGASEGVGSLVYSLFEDHRANLWCGSAAGVLRFANGRFEPAPPLAEVGSALAIYQDRDGSLWFGSGAGLFQYRDGVVSRRRISTPRGDPEIRSLGQDLAGDIWVGTIAGGLFCLQSNRFEHFGAAQGLSNPDARSLWCDADGGVWVGTLGGGLFHKVAGRFQAITTADGLPDDTINSIVEDENGILWMGSYNGYFGCARRLLERYERGRSPALVCQRLNLADGLHFRTCSGAGQPAASRSAAGRIWFANQGSLAGFTPGGATRHRLTAEVVIESVLVDGREQLSGLAEGVRVSSGARRYEFHYSSPDPDSAVGLSFRYKLAGLDKDWFEAGPRRVAYYNPIPPGSYKFQAMVGGPDGHWREAEPSVPLEVVPRWWERRPVQGAAMVGFLLALTGSVWGVARARYHRRLERLEAQQAMEHERRRIAQDLHDDLGTSLTEISLLSAVARSPSASDHEVHAHLDAIVEKSSEMVKALDEIVWAANPKNDSVRNFVNYLTFFAREYLQPTPIRCRLDVPPSLPETHLNAEQRHTLYLVAKEALANAAKHSGASELWLRVTLSQDSLGIAIEDNGKGFDPAAPSNRNGLSNMRSRMEQIGGRFEISTAPARGTRATFELPLHPIV